ncbi:MAG: DUF3159 domain-containing protein [Microbacteriaceae bacterium]
MNHESSNDPELPQPGQSQPGQQGQPTAAPDSVARTLGQGLAAAAKRSGLGAVADGHAPSSRNLLLAMGGVRGLAETILPSLVFLVVYTFTKDVPWAIGTSVLAAVIFTVLRLIARTPVTQAVAGLLGVGASAVLALLTGRGEDNFVLGLLTNGAYGAVLLVSILVGWPLLGLAIGYLMNDGLNWRKDKPKFRAMQLLTALWVAMFVARLAVQLPLYYGHNVEGLAIAKLAMGLPLYVPLLLVSWLIVRSVYPHRQR